MGQGAKTFVETHQKTASINCRLYGLIVCLCRKIRHTIDRQECEPDLARIPNLQKALFPGESVQTRERPTGMTEGSFVRVRRAHVGAGTCRFAYQAIDLTVTRLTPQERAQLGVNLIRNFVRKVVAAAQTLTADLGPPLFPDR